MWRFERKGLLSGRKQLCCSGKGKLLLTQNCWCVGVCGGGGDVVLDCGLVVLWWVMVMVMKVDVLMEVDGIVNVIMVIASVMVVMVLLSAFHLCLVNLFLLVKAIEVWCL